MGFGGLRFWPQKKIRFFGCGVFRGLRIFRFSAFGFRFSSKTISGLRIRYANGFRFLFDLSSNFAPPLISNSCETLYAPFVTNVWDQLGFCQLGCENLSVLTILQAVFGFDRFSFFFVLFFLQFWIIFSTVLRFLINPNAYPPPQASTTQIIRAMSHREWVTLRRIVLPFFILHAEIACSQRLKTTVHHVSSYISYAGRPLSVFFHI